MSNRNYYYLISSLPRLRLDDYHEYYRLADFIQDLEKHLTPEHLGFVRDVLAMQDDLSGSFYKKMTQHANQFIRQYFKFDQDLRNILIALNKKKFNISRGKYVGLEEDDVISALKNSSLGDFGLSSDLDYISELIERFQNLNLVDFEKYFDQLRWDKINSINTFKYFEVDVLLGYLIKTMTTERWLGLVAQKGEKIFQQRIATSLAAA